MGKEIFIVGGGSSLHSFNFNRLINKETIVVNKSMFHVPCPNYMITMDFTFITKVGVQRFNSINTTKVFVINFVPNYMRWLNGMIVDIRSNLVYDLHDFDLLIKSKFEVGMGSSFRDFRHGGNSGFCALQLAVLLNYDVIYLLGIDLNLSGQRESSGRSHYHEGYGESLKSFNTKLKKYYTMFVAGMGQLKSIKPDVKVFSCSSTSRLNQIIEYKPIDDALKELK